MTSIFLLFLLMGCAKMQLTTWHLQPHEKLLAKNKLEITDKTKIDKEELTSYIRQKPNRGVLLNKWKLGLQWQNLWYRKGSGKKIPGIIIDSSLVERSQKQIEIFMKNDRIWIIHTMKYFIILKRKKINMEQKHIFLEPRSLFHKKCCLI